mmetsp:Transcript_11366/g.35001  ORF Transcript_11366/g.35001 Transcript_11366/m.35001 type:complete len:272 (-) Transcript_11366:611-1426(-)
MRGGVRGRALRGPKGALRLLAGPGRVRHQPGLHDQPVPRGLRRLRRAPAAAGAVFRSIPGLGCRAAGPVNRRGPDAEPHDQPDDARVRRTRRRPEPRPAGHAHRGLPERVRDRGREGRRLGARPVPLDGHRGGAEPHEGIERLVHGDVSRPGHHGRRLAPRRGPRRLRRRELHGAPPLHRAEARPAAWIKTRLHAGADAHARGAPHLLRRDLPRLRAVADGRRALVPRSTFGGAAQGGPRRRFSRREARRFPFCGSADAARAPPFTRPRPV